MDDLIRKLLSPNESEKIFMTVQENGRKCLKLDLLEEVLNVEILVNVTGIEDRTRDNILNMFIILFNKHYKENTSDGNNTTPLYQFFSPYHIQFLQLLSIIYYIKATIQWNRGNEKRAVEYALYAMNIHPLISDDFLNSCYDHILIKSSYGFVKPISFDQIKDRNTYQNCMKYYEKWD